MTIAVQTRQLTEPILDSGIQNTNYFNGRILAAGDLQADQEANRRQHEQLGLGLGAGVVSGFEVTLVDSGAGGKPPVVGVTQGLAFNRNGQAVALPLDVRVAFSLPPAPPPIDAGLFGDCAPPSTATVPKPAGFYILTASPASGFSGRAPMYGFGDVNTATGCGSSYAVEGVRFDLVGLDTSKLANLSQATRDAIAALMQKTDAASVSQLRNWMAHICFGTEEVAGFPLDPFSLQKGQSPYVSYGAIDALIASGAGAAGALTFADVPLALISWTNTGVSFVDMWSVRRRLMHPPLSATWPLPFSARRRAEGEAIFLQFEAQVADMIGANTQASLSVVRAVDYFRYLPPAGAVPLAGFGPAKGFDSIQFFDGHTTHEPVFIEGSLLQPLISVSLGYPPVDLSDQQMVWLYAIRENMQSVGATILGRPTASMIFATGHIRYQGDAHFDLSRWDFANFALVP